MLSDILSLFLCTGEWRAKQIENPDYKGEWEHPQIPNPDWVEIKDVAKFKDLAGVGIEIWQVSNCEEMIFESTFHPHVEYGAVIPIPSCL